MKAITVIQPWATLAAIKAKEYETRGWATDYRGQLGIHAGKDPRFVYMRSQDYICGIEPYCSILNKNARRIAETYPHPLEMAKRIMPLGAMIAVCDLVDCIPTIAIADMLSDQERAFGDFTPGRFAWKLENVRMLPEPILMRGKQGLWEWREG